MNPATLRGAAIAFIVTVTVAAGACGGARSGNEDRTSASGAPKVADRTMTLRYEVEATGDISFAYDEETPVRVLTVLGGGAQFAPLNVLSVGTPVPFARTDGALARVAFDLTAFRGDGLYAIRAGAPRDLLATAEEAKANPNAAAPDQSNVLVHLWPGTDQSAVPEIFDRALEPCEVEVDEGGGRGVMTCPQVTNDSGKTFRLVMRWGPS